jgi:hypothetical protein
MKSAPSCQSPGDEEVDAVNNSLFRELLTYMMEDPRNVSVCIHLLFCAKNIERMGDPPPTPARRAFPIGCYRWRFEG